MQTAIYSIILLGSSVLGAGGTPNQQTIYESLDGRTVLMVSGLYFYLGPRDHPEARDFVRQYGQALGRKSVAGGTCLSLGVFKIAIIDRKRSVCDNVHIERTPERLGKNVDSYVAICFKLRGAGCSRKGSSGKPALEYGYDAERKRGVTVIYLSDKSSRGPSNTLVLKSGEALLR